MYNIAASILFEIPNIEFIQSHGRLGYLQSGPRRHQKPLTGQGLRDYYARMEHPQTQNTRFEP